MAHGHEWNCLTDAGAKLLLELTRQRDLHGFPRFNFASGKLPIAGKMATFEAPRKKHAAF